MTVKTTSKNLSEKEKNGTTVKRKEVMTIEDGYSKSKADHKGNEDQ